MTNEHDAPDDQASNPHPASRRENQFEVVATVLLAFAVLATAWTATRRRCRTAFSRATTQASAARTEAAQLRTEANVYRLADLSVFENYIDAFIDGDEELAAFYRDRFRPEFEPAYVAWIALDPFENPDAPPSPFGLPEYQLQADEEAVALELRADTLFEEGEIANTDSDEYTLATLLFAVVLFFAAISERFEYIRMRVILLALAAAGLIAGVAVAFGQPITTG